MHLYIHVPFCSRRCSYCDFAIAVRRTVPVDAFVDAVARELSLRKLGGDALATVYLGGGTPSKLGGAGVARLLTLLRGTFALDADAEVTIEANPEDVTEQAAAAWREAGVNRLSLGVQSFDPKVLKWMHRTHDADQSGAAVTAARRAGIDNVSVDLIFALPADLERDWLVDVQLAVALEPSHISAYGLTVERATPLGRWSARGDVTAASDDAWADEFLLGAYLLASAGYTQYEVSNFALDGHRSCHNQAYWLGAPYLGVGPSAHGYDGSVRRWNIRDYVAWTAALVAGRDPLEGSEQLGEAERIAERVYLGLRSDAGLELEPGDDVVVKPWVDAGWGYESERHGSRVLTLTEFGWMRLDTLATTLTIARSRY